MSALIPWVQQELHSLTFIRIPSQRWGCKVNSFTGRTPRICFISLFLANSMGVCSVNQEELRTFDAYHSSYDYQYMVIKISMTMYMVQNSSLCTTCMHFLNQINYKHSYNNLEDWIIKITSFNHFIALSCLYFKDFFNSFEEVIRKNTIKSS